MHQFDLYVKDDAPAAARAFSEWLTKHAMAPGTVVALRATASPPVALAAAHDHAATPPPTDDDDVRDDPDDPDDDADLDAAKPGITYSGPERPSSSPETLRDQRDRFATLAPRYGLTAADWLRPVTYLGQPYVLAGIWARGYKFPFLAVRESDGAQYRMPWAFIPGARKKYEAWRAPKTRRDGD